MEIVTLLDEVKQIAKEIQSLLIDDGYISIELFSPVDFSSGDDDWDITLNYYGDGKSCHVKGTYVGGGDLEETLQMAKLQYGKLLIHARKTVENLDHHHLSLWLDKVDLVILEGVKPIKVIAGRNRTLQEMLDMASIWVEKIYHA